MAPNRVLRSLLPFEVELTRLSDFDRRQLTSIQKWFRRLSSIHSKEQERQLNEGDDKIDANTLQKVIQNYLLNSLTEELSVKKNYVEPFKVILFLPQNTRHRGLLSTEYAFNETGHLEGMQELEFDHLSLSSSFSLSQSSISITAPSSPTTGTTNSYLRRRTAKTLHTYSYGGAVAFEQLSDPSSPKLIPTETNVQAKQLQAILDEDSILLNDLRQTSPTSGLTTTINVNIKLINSVSSRNPSPADTTAATDNEFDVIIVVAIAVAACSMILLGFALFLAFRRRQRQRGGRSKAIGSPMNQDSKKTASDNSPSTRAEKHEPPVLEMRMDLENDDNISDYTESVFSMPVVHEKGKGVYGAGGHTTSVVSTHFAPRYIGVEERSGECDSSEDVTEIGGVPPPIAVDSGRGGARKPPVVTPTEEQTPPSVMAGLGLGGDLYPNQCYNQLIDDDINSSLEAYNVEGMMKLAAGDKNDDNLSLSSTETYGFSLDGMNSTVANSTKYGY